MRIQISAIGRLKSGPERQLAIHYVTRAGTSGRALGISSVDIVEHAESSAVSKRLRQEEEAGRLVSGLSAGAKLVALHHWYKELSSNEFAEMIRREIDGGTASLVFLIGGPDGLSHSIKQNARGHLSLGLMTWPHRLARVMIAEQIYRAVTILINHPYHRG